ncbi:hypothetical protein [uncultured Legionella sp.]|uniref:hypothetical protein n=1 Tax=uncultured Legionella sp. TaxID=210934 RepID=UPI002620BF1E|nr:hypothetical protein [uncultured Legionella sp.]
MTKSKVDNSGLGNCMYYAYGISLMYFLQAKKDNHTTQIVFENLGLNSEEQEALSALLKKEQDFSLTEIKDIIEPIFGPAARALGAARTRDEFLKKPDDSPIFTSANYGIEYEFARLLFEKDPSLAMLLSSDFTDRDYTTAEIYNVPNIRPGMEEFATKQINTLLQDFQHRWNNKLETLIDQSDENLIFQRSQILNTIIREKTVVFFLENDEAYLNKYIKMLNTNFVWGSEETMMALHRAVTGEKMTRNPETTRIDTTWDVEIPLVLYRNGHKAVDNTLGSMPDPVMILNNMDNVHWVSLVQLNPLRQELVAFPPDKAASEENTPPANSKDNVPDTNKEDEDLELALILPSSNDTPTETIHRTNPELQLIPPQNPSEGATRKNILFLTGFETNLKAIKEKAKDLKQRGFTAESELAKGLYKKLRDSMNKFISSGTENSRQADIQSFANSCTPFVKTALNSELAHHRGIKRLLNNIMNIIVSVCTVGLINWNLGKLTIIDSFPTQSINKINELQDSVIKVSGHKQAFFIKQENKEQLRVYRPIYTQI